MRDLKMAERGILRLSLPVAYKCSISKICVWLHIRDDEQLKIEVWHAIKAWVVVSSFYKKPQRCAFL